MPHGDATLGEIFHAQRIAERLRQFLEFQNFLRVGFFVHAMQRADAAIVEITRDGLVRRQHEFLDQAVRDVALAADDADHVPGFVEFDHRLGQIEINRAELAAPRVENQGQIAHVAEFFRQGRVLRGAFPDRLRARCSPWCRSCARRSESRRARIPRDDFSVRVQFHDRAHHQAVLLRIERANSVGEFFGQHGHGAIRKIDGSAAQPRLAIERRSAPHVVRDVGDVHLQLPVAVRRGADVHGVVEIARRFAVNRDDGQDRGNRGAPRARRRPPDAPRRAASASTSAENRCGR